MKFWPRIITLAFLFLPVFANAAYVVDARTGKLSDCGDTMAYAANFALMENNPGQAKVFIFQHARAVTALLAQNYDNGIVSGERTAAWKARGPALKQYLDTHQNELPNIVNNCYSVIQQAVNDPKIQGIKMWNKSFTDLVSEMAAKTRAMYGL
jgi:hypothetical protein